MSRHIDADAFDERVRISVGLVEEELTEDYKDGVRCTLELLKTQPTADVVEVVRCKDCEEWQTDLIPEYGREGSHFCPVMEYCTMPDDYCSYGERRKDD